jgi:hypothetical protein
MARYELLNNVAHKGLRVVTRFGCEFGDQVGMVPAFPTEYAELQREYPIFFRKDREDGGYQSVAMLGFDKQENLFLQGEHWNATYLPGYIAKGPFLIGFQEQWDDGELRKEPVIHVDLDHPRASFDEGEPVFLAQGGHSPYLQHVTTVLGGIHDIDRERLAALEADKLHALHRWGFLEGAFLVLASMHNMRRLMAEKQRRLRLQAGTGSTEHVA